MYPNKDLDWRDGLEMLIETYLFKYGQSGDFFLYYACFLKMFNVMHGFFSVEGGKERWEGEK